MNGRLRRAAKAALVLAVLQVGLFLPHLASDGVFWPVRPDASPPWFDPARKVEAAQDLAGTDKVAFNHPNVVRWVREIRRDPAALLWNPDILCGISFLATQNTHVLYPLNALYLVTGAAEGMLWSALLHGWLASFLAWCALRRCVREDGAAMVGAFVYGGGAWFLVHHDLIQYIHAATWIPLVIWGADRLVMRPGVAGAVAVSLGLMLSFLGGMPQITILGLLAAGMLAGCRALVVARRSGVGGAVRGIAAAAGAVVVGCLLAAPQLLPTLEIRADSGRAEIPLETLREGSMEPIELTGLVIPELLGNPAELWKEGTSEPQFLLSKEAGLGRTGDTLIERAFYPGVAALLLGLLALLPRPDPRALPALLLVLVGILGALGTPLLDLLYHLPGFQFANHRRLVFLAAIGLAYLAALGVESARERSSRWRLGLPLALGLACGVLLLSAIAWPGALLDRITAEGGEHPQGSLVARWIRDRTWPAVALFALAVPWLGTAPRRPWILPVGALLLLVVDLGWLHQKVSPPQEACAVHPATATTDWLQERRGDLRRAPAPAAEGLFRIVRYKNRETAFPGTGNDLPALPPNTALVYEIPDVQGYESIVDRHLEEVMERVETGLPVEHHLIREMRDPASVASPLLDLLGVRYVLTSSPVMPGLVRVAAFPAERVAIHERPGALPRFQTPPEVVIAESEEQVLELMSAASYDPRAAAILLREDAERLALPELAPDASRWRRPAEVASWELLSYRPTEVRIRYRASSPTPLRMADTYHPGWIATSSDGEDLPLVRSDHMLRMVLLPPGERTVVFSFQPKSFFWGLVAAAVGAAALLIVAVLAWRRRRRRERVPAHV